jgi:hypothetical protein
MWLAHEGLLYSILELSTLIVSAFEGVIFRNTYSPPLGGILGPFREACLVIT